MHFTRIVNVPQRDAAGVPVLSSDKQSVVKKTLGTFTFKELNYLERKSLLIQRSHELSMAGGKYVEPDAFMAIEVSTMLSRVIVEPKDFDLSPLTDEEALAIYEAYQDGLKEVSSKNA